jgi:hypothetical protein
MSLLKKGLSFHILWHILPANSIQKKYFIQEDFVEFGWLKIACRPQNQVQSVKAGPNCKKSVRFAQSAAKIIIFVKSVKCAVKDGKIQTQ